MLCSPFAISKLVEICKEKKSERIAAKVYEYSKTVDLTKLTDQERESIWHSTTYYILNKK